jgi:hypothetical protein
MTTNEKLNLLLGVLFGILLSVCAVVVKDAIVFRINCDGVTVSEWSGDRHCIDQSILEGGK